MMTSTLFSLLLMQGQITAKPEQFDVFYFPPDISLNLGVSTESVRDWFNLGSLVNDGGAKLCGLIAERHEARGFNPMRVFLSFRRGNTEYSVDFKGYLLVDEDEFLIEPKSFSALRSYVHALIPYSRGDTSWDQAKYTGNSQSSIDRVLCFPNAISPAQAQSEQVQYDISSLLEKNFAALENILAETEHGEQFSSGQVKRTSFS
jgi:hypothetical protein